MVSKVLWAWKWLVVSLTGKPNDSDNLLHTFIAKSGWVFTPVPTAVPPIANSDNWLTTSNNLSILLSICPE